jgi:hypothetical protein
MARTALKNQKPTGCFESFRVVNDHKEGSWTISEPEAGGAGVEGDDGKEERLDSRTAIEC